MKPEEYEFDTECPYCGETITVRALSARIAQKQRDKFRAALEKIAAGGEHHKDCGSFWRIAREALGDEYEQKERQL